MQNILSPNFVFKMLFTKYRVRLMFTCTLGHYIQKGIFYELLHRKHLHMTILDLNKTSTLYLYGQQPL